MDQARALNLIVESRLRQSLIASSKSSQSCYAIGVVNGAIRPCAPGQRVAKAKNQVLLLVQKLFADIDLGEEVALINFRHGPRPLVLARLLQIDAIPRTVQSHFSLLSATLRTDL